MTAVANDLIFVEVGCRQLSLFYTRPLLWGLLSPLGNSVTLFLLHPEIDSLPVYEGGQRGDDHY